MLKPLLVMCYFSVCFFTFIPSCSLLPHLLSHWQGPSTRLQLCPGPSKAGDWGSAGPDLCWTLLPDLSEFQTSPANTKGRSGVSSSTQQTPQHKGQMELSNQHPKFCRFSCGAEAKRGASVHPVQCHGRAQLWDMRNTSMRPEKGTQHLPI